MSWVAKNKESIDVDVAGLLCHISSGIVSIFYPSTEFQNKSSFNSNDKWNVLKHLLIPCFLLLLPTFITWNQKYITKNILLDKKENTYF